MDKKPQLPKDDVFTTQEISQMFHGSPKKYLYGANRAIKNTLNPQELSSDTKNQVINYTPTYLERSSAVIPRNKNQADYNQEK